MRITTRRRRLFGGTELGELDDAAAPFSGGGADGAGLDDSEDIVSTD
jgi:hypothetical protein